MIEDYEGVVGIYSKKNVLTNGLTEKFNEKYLNVKIFDNLNKLDLLSLDYLIINLLESEEQLTGLSTRIKNVKCKTLILFPLLIRSNQKFVVDTELSNLSNLNTNVGVMLVPEILGDKVSYNPNFISHNLIMQSIVSERVKISSDKILVNVISLKRLVAGIIKSTLSFGISGSIVALQGTKLTKKHLLNYFLKVKNDNIISSKDETDLVEVDSSASIKTENITRVSVTKTRDSFLENTRGTIQEKTEQTTERNSKTAKFKVRRLVNIASFVVSILVAPFVVLLSSFVLTYLSTVYMLKDSEFSKFLVTKSIWLTKASVSLSFGNKFIYESASLITKTNHVIFEGITIVNEGKNFISQIIGEENYDLTLYSNSMSASLDKLYTEMSFLQSDVNKFSGFVGKWVKEIVEHKGFNLSVSKEKVYLFKNLFSRASDLLGADKPKKYLILFQNNMELRPTGGFIGSFGLVTFDKGRMTEIVINDVYSADGQLKGHVNPPEPIRLHLGEGGWALRDSNWSPDFAISAEKAEWFLEKEMNQEVEGVIGIDLGLIQNILSIIGSINLPDFNQVITADNLYEVTQKEVENEFFPGSIKKASFLTALSRNIINEIKNLPSDKYPQFLNALYESFEKKHVQIYLHNKSAQEVLTKLRYSGRLQLNHDCGERCLSDGYSLIDANLGVNKANLFIKRSQDLALTISKQSIGHELLVTYQNSASQAIGKAGVYKSYTRLIAPNRSRIIGIKVYETDGSSQHLDYDVIQTDDWLEAGFLLELFPGSQKKIQIVWDTPSVKLTHGGEYNLRVIKQAGTDADKLNVFVRSTDLALTGKGALVYNTNLARDFETKFFLK